MSADHVVRGYHLVNLRAALEGIGRFVLRHAVYREGKCELGTSPEKRPTLRSQEEDLTQINGRARLTDRDGRWPDDAS